MYCFVWFLVLVCLSLQRAKCVLCFHSAALIILILCASFTLSELDLPFSFFISLTVFSMSDALADIH